MSPQKNLFIAMWSGPRNISTALMRSFENRPDTFVCDEPFYAHYLSHTGYNHPDKDLICEQHETNWQKVVEQLTNPPSAETSIFYQKQMAHHLLDHIDRSWLLRPDFQHGFLLRDPEDMLLSLIKILPDVTLLETGLPQQLELFQLIQQESETPPVVIHAPDLLASPQQMLGAICESFSIEFTPKMVSWPSGSRESDGIWGKHWYTNAYRSTQFGKYTDKNEELPDGFRKLLDECQEIYSQLEPFCIAPLST
ncbi:MAG: HAD family hydrolase [Planctomycetaceae bacterium]|nr:HAD family hydrolase [Planctomycetaceae bacterium]